MKYDSELSREMLFEELDNSFALLRNDILKAREEISAIRNFILAKSNDITGDNLATE